MKDNQAHLLLDKYTEAIGHLRMASRGFMLLTQDNRDSALGIEIHVDEALRIFEDNGPQISEEVGR